MYVECTVDPAAFINQGGFANWVRAHMVIVVGVNRIILKRKLVPPLYKSGVRFREEPPGVETFVDALTCFKARFGDCAHLAAWRCAELQEQGEKAAIRVKWTQPVYHVQVRRGNGSIEDPSALLGMH